jgi:hypothetical protein
MSLASSQTEGVSVVPGMVSAIAGKAAVSAASSGTEVTVIRRIIFEVPIVFFQCV